jgi:molecular chaperone GrpE
MEDQHANNNQESAVIDYQHQLQQCQIDLAASNEKLRESREKYTYLLADWDNFKRRMEKERAQWIVNAQAAVFTDVLGIVDDFERAFNDINAKGLPEELKTRFQGFELIHKSFLKLLAKYE